MKYSKKQIRQKRVIMVLCDGLGADWLSDERVPVLAELKKNSMSFNNHHAVFPSVTRVSAATVATGCYPGTHGLHGNQMALLINDHLEVHNAGVPGFRDIMRKATGSTLQVKTLAEHVVQTGGQVVYSNVSPGAAYFLDPEHFGHVYHRAGSFASGGEKITGMDHLDVSHDLAGDLEMTIRFCAEVVRDGMCAVGILWLANPDLTLHYHEPGSPAHIDALGSTDQMVSIVNRAVELARDEQDILFIVASDHGHEVISKSIHIGQWLAENGMADEMNTGQICVAGQGTSALVYATEQGKKKLITKLELIEQQEWVSSVLNSDMLGQVGLADIHKLVFGIDMARVESINHYGVSGARWMVEDGELSIELNCGQHGGLGSQETHPFLFLNHHSFSARQIERPTSLIDIAPTILDFLGISHDSMDGQSLLADAVA